MQECALKFLAIGNACIRLGHWPVYFKTSTSVIIPKPGKDNYSTPKSFRPIVLLNTMGKLIEKMLARRLQFESVKFDILHPHQFGGIFQRSTEDAGLFLTHAIRAGWARKKKTSIIAFDVAQFFPSLNHNMLIAILRAQGFAPLLLNFFSDYLTGRKTEYLWKGERSPLFDSNVGVGQGSALSPILSALYMAPVLRLFDIRMAPKAKLWEFETMSYVDNGNLVAQLGSLEKNVEIL
jgi:retron-type reverse transcriptase